MFAAWVGSGVADIGRQLAIRLPNESELVCCGASGLCLRASILVVVGQGAILPLVALSARALGASVGTAALIVALIGIGQLIADLGGALAARSGRRALIAPALLTRWLCSLFWPNPDLAAIASRSPAWPMSSVWLGTPPNAIPVPFRARALSTWAGFRIGLH
jgi:hypothetical protein